MHPDPRCSTDLGARRPRRGVPRILSALAFGLAGLTGGGCNIAAPVLFIIEGPPKKVAAHTLDPKAATVVLVDDPANRLPSRSLRSDIAQQAERVLLDEDVLVDIIDARDAMRVTAGDRYGKLTSISEVGAAVGASIVIYVRIEAFQVSADGVSYSPLIGANVKVIDVATQERVWPEEYDGAELRVQMREPPGEAPKSLAERAEINRKMAQELGLAVAQLFYEHDIRRSAGKPKAR
ncbi:MAG: hypothetical protein HRU70_03325 [Phycisphaeraceae bacterium]|nr:MAG: hypothetical protein HRU70_03325 [Phycisphaeraceae bacterium]